MKKRLMLTCQDASKLLSKGQEQTLRFRERWALKIHLFFLRFLPQLCPTNRVDRPGVSSYRQPMEHLSPESRGQRTYSGYVEKGRARIGL